MGTDLRTAAQQALAALYPISHNSTDDYRGQADKAITALRAALEQPEQEPVAMCRTWHKGSDQHAELLDWTDALEALPDGEHHLYTHPPRREWRGLTDEEIIKLARGELEKPINYSEPAAWQLADGIARAIEAALKERNA